MSPSIEKYELGMRVGLFANTATMMLLLLNK